MFLDRAGGFNFCKKLILLGNMSKRPGKNKSNMEETHRKFLAIAREEFAEYGYAEASTSRIVQKSGMARGSLYYHFGDKNGLFKAVYEEIMFEGLAVISAEMDKAETPWGAFQAGTYTFMDLCMDETYRKIVLLEAQGAMSFQERFAVHEKTLLGKLSEILPKLLKDGYFPGHTLETISIFIFGILAEIGRSMDSSRDIHKSRKVFGHAFDKTLELMVPKS